MELKDALTITFLGIGVVFIGLILTNLMIYSFSIFPKLLDLFKRKKSIEAESVVAHAQPEIEVEPDVIAIITAVLEVEFKKLSLLEGKFTFK